MPINITLTVTIILVYFSIIVGLLVPLAKRKTQTPSLTVTIGILLAFIPPLAILYLAVLALKNDQERMVTVKN